MNIKKTYHNDKLIDLIKDELEDGGIEWLVNHIIVAVEGMEDSEVPAVYTIRLIVKEFENRLK